MGQYCVCTVYHIRFTSFTNPYIHSCIPVYYSTYTLYTIEYPEIISSYNLTAGGNFWPGGTSDIGRHMYNMHLLYILYYTYILL